MAYTNEAMIDDVHDTLVDDARRSFDVIATSRVKAGNAVVVSNTAPVISTAAPANEATRATAKKR